MQALDFVRFHIIGHDRGGRGAYRMALDCPDMLASCAVLDIIPTSEVWAGMNATRAKSMYHWMFLAQPAPLPERLISAHPIAYLDHTLVSWTAAKNLNAFAPDALAHYRAVFNEPQCIHAMCADYHASGFFDRALDEEDFQKGRKINLPLLALWGDAGLPAQGESPKDIWARWGDDVRGHAISSGHFVAEENPAAAATALIDFLLSVPRAAA